MYGIIFFVLIVGVVIGIAIFYIDRDVGLSDVELEKCEALEENNENGIDVVFFGEDKESALDYIDYFFNVNPFSIYRDRFNFYYVAGYYPLCEIYKDVAILCYSRELVKKAGSCPNDYIVVLNDDEGDDIRSSSYMNVMSLNAKHPKSVLIHEFGHAFVNLAEEYVPAKIPRNSAGNCVADCAEFEGKNDGCYQGCSLGEYSRSVENGIMRTLRTDNYGKFNEWVVVSKIEKLTSSGEGITGKAVGDVSRGCASQGYLLIEGEVVDGEIEISGKEFVAGCYGENGGGGYSAEISLEDGNVVDVGKGGFNPLEIFTDEPDKSPDELNEGEMVMMSGDTFDNSAPIYTDAPVDGGIEGGIFERGIPFYVKAPIPLGEEEEEAGNEIQSVTIKDEIGEPVASISVCADMPGDVDGNGKVDISDIALLGGYLGGKNDIVCLDNADVNGNGNVGIDDRKALEIFLFGEIRRGKGGLPSVGPSVGPSAAPSAGPSATASAGPSVSASAFPTSTARTSPTASASATASGSPSASKSPVSAVGGKSFFDRISGLITGWFSKVFGD